MEEVILNKVDELIPLLHVHGLQHKMLRGHTNACYRLKPGLTRGIADADTAKKLDKQLFEKFRLDVSNFNLESHFNSPPNKEWEFANEWEWYFQAQHCRLATRFLDWTIKWEVAVSFMLGTNIKNDDIDGAIWILNSDYHYMKPTTEESDYKNISPFEFDKSLMIYPPICYTDEGYEKKLGGNRQSVQLGKFTIQSYEASVIPMEEQIGVKDCLVKLIVPYKLKHEIRKRTDFFLYTQEHLYFKSSFGLDEIANEVNKSVTKVLFNS